MILEQAGALLASPATTVNNKCRMMIPGFFLNDSAHWVGVQAGRGGKRKAGESIGLHLLERIRRCCRQNACLTT